MSWLKRRGQNTTPSPAPTGQLADPVPMYNPNQAVNNQWQQPNNWYQNQQQQQHQQYNTLAPQQQNYWEQQGYQEHQSQQLYNQNAQQYQNQNTTYTNNPSELPANQETYRNLQYNQQYNTQNNSFQPVDLQTNENDSWGNWGWGDEDNSNVQNVQPVQSKPSKTSQDLTANFTNDETWNWPVEDPSNQVKEKGFQDEVPAKEIPELIPKMGKHATLGAAGDQAGETAASLVPPPGVVKRNKLETPQWSMESQVSQESSDDILQTSESDNHLVSSSTVSHSPLSGFDNAQPIKEDLPPDNVSLVYHHIENREIIRNDSSPGLRQSRPPSVPTPSFPPIPSSNASQEDLKNPYKRNPSIPSKSTAGQFSGRQTIEPVNQSVNLETVPDNSEHPDAPLPTAKPFTPGMNSARTSHLLTWHNIDNIEVPMNDRNQYLETGQLSDTNQMDYPREPEHDLNGVRSNQEDTLPPPGLRRMIPGQIEQQATGGNVENFNDEPPPGLSRMVLGQNESNTQTTQPTSENVSNPYEHISPPEGLRRMVPGESSSPESSTRQPAFQNLNDNNDYSDQEFEQVPQLRSATIGADTPPAASATAQVQSNLNATDRSETIGAADSGENLGGSSVSPSIERKSSRRTKDKKFDNQRREYIKGRPTDSEMSSLVSGVRNLAVGENFDGTTETAPKRETRKKQSRQETSESEEEKSGKSPRDRKDRRYKGDRREMDYSPESRDRRYDRRKYRGQRHYDENADHYSDGERAKADRDYDKKYYSLRKDKEKDRRRRGSPREYDRDGRRYHRYDDAFDNEERSRPSSRSDSLHDSVYRSDRRQDKDPRDRRKDRPRDRDKHRRPRDPYAYSQGYGGYDPYNSYYQQYQYQYYENLRRTNPQAYAEIYRKYYEQHGSRNPQAYGQDDRSSVHSGRSSANEELTKDRYTRQSYYSHSSIPYMSGYYPRDSKTSSISGHYNIDESSFQRPKDQTDSFIYEDSSGKLGRVTPAKFATAHTKVSIKSGILVRVVPNYPLGGQLPLVELAPLEAYLQKDDEFRELASYPGPLIKDVTHKKTVIEYCENKIKTVGSNLDISDPDSYILLWELLILLLRQNGKVVGTDIAELLLKTQSEELSARPSSGLSNLSNNTCDNPLISESSNPQVSEGLNGSAASVLKEEEVTNKFREYLLYGSGQEALEWAMKHGLWGHALFLASKLGKRTYSNVMVRFANGLTFNDPLQTLYQLLSGRMPAAVTSVVDEKWGDWKPHLAMILSNSSLQPELNRKAITTLGDTLMARGSLYAAQFCYLMAEVGFGRYGTENVKVVLLGSNHNKPFNNFATNEAIHMTEIYEYACSLNDPAFAVPELQVYKCLLATRLADRGLLEKSLAYLEKTALYIVNNATNVQSSLVNNVLNLADRLKYCDPVGADEEDENTNAGVDSRLDSAWLKNLRTVQNDIDSGLIPTYDNQNITLTDNGQTIMYDTGFDQTGQSVWQQSQVYSQQYSADNSLTNWQTDHTNHGDNTLEDYQQGQQKQLEGYTPSFYQDQQQNYWANQQQQWDTSTSQPSTESLDQNQQNYYNSTNTQKEDEGRPQISMPNQSRGKTIFDDDEPLPHEKVQNQKAPEKNDNQAQQKQNSSGWFGGIFSKLALKPKNQMKLPDDKNPTIVWDQEKKRWVNVDEDNNTTSSSEIKPPPKLTDIKPVTSKPPLPQGTYTNQINNNPSTQAQLNSVSNNNLNIPRQVPQNDNRMPVPEQDIGQMQGNMFKLQKSRNMKKSYIDVFNPGGTPAKPAVLAPEVGAFPPSNAGPRMNFFVPQPVNDPNAPTNFLTQGTPLIQGPHDDSAQIKQ